MSQPATVIVLSRDIFFAMRIRGVLRQLGWQMVLAKTEQDYVAAVAGDPDAPLAIVDFNQTVNWGEVTSIAGGPPVVAFGAHTDVDGFRAARAAGVARTVSNGEFDRSLPSLIERYRRTS